MIFNKGLPQKGIFYFQGKEIKIVNSTRIYDSHSFPQVKKHKGIENLLKKALKAWFTIQRLLFKWTLDTYLHLTVKIVKPIALYA